MKTEDDYYELLSKQAFKVERDSRTICEAAIDSQPRRHRRANYNAWRRKNERRLQRKMLEEAKSAEGVEGPVIMGLIGWLATPILNRVMEYMLDAAQKALWAAVKKHVREILDNMDLHFFPEDQK